MRFFVVTLILAFASALLLMPNGVALAQTTQSGEDIAPPPEIEYLKSKRYDETVSALSDDAMPLDIRRQAIKEAALSYGARGGLAYRTYFIRSELDQYNAQLDKIFDFRQLLIAAPSGVLIEPPIVSEAQDAILIENDGQKAAVSDAIYNINRNARFTSTARSWRQYLERDWGEVKDPPAILLPKNDEEIAIWEELIEKGWAEGITQADEIFQEDLNRLTADFEGMVRYRKLLAYGMITPPFANQTDRGVTGGGEEMRVGDRALEITGKPSLQPGASAWQPVSR